MYHNHMVGGENDWDENAPQKIVDESAEKPSVSGFCKGSEL